MFGKEFMFVLIALGALVLTTAGQKPGEAKAKATPTPATRASDDDKAMDKAAAEFKKTLNALVKMIDSGFKDIRGEEKPKNSGDLVKRFKTSMPLMQAEACEITLPTWAGQNSRRGHYVAYYPLVPQTERKKMYLKLVEAVTTALGPEYQRVRIADDYDEDSIEEKYVFMRKGSLETLVTVSYCASQSQFDPVKSDVIVTVGYSLS